MIRLTPQEEIEFEKIYGKLSDEEKNQVLERIAGSLTFESSKDSDES